MAAAGRSDERRLFEYFVVAGLKVSVSVEVSFIKSLKFENTMKVKLQHSPKPVPVQLEKPEQIAFDLNI